MAEHEHDAAVMWRNISRPGHESAYIHHDGSLWHLKGTAVFLAERDACCLGYSIVCDSRWRTRACHVDGWIGRRHVDVRISVRPDGRWERNDDIIAGVDGATDIDLNFSPSTNLLPIRRLNLAVGESADVKAAWLRFPSMRVELLEQTYTRTAENRYLYRSRGGAFTAELTVDQAGFVTMYPGGWEALTADSP